MIWNPNKECMPREQMRELQKLGEQSVVFVETDKGYAVTPVVLGQTDGSHAEVIAGLAPGQRYVADGAFELKARIITNGLGAHAGHGH